MAFLAERINRRTIRIARTEALFASSLSAADEPAADEVAAAIRDAIHRHGGSRGCASQMAAAYGDQPETAAARMRWAIRVVQTCYPAVRRRLSGHVRTADRTVPSVH
jgi:hypothetical protein